MNYNVLKIIIIIKIIIVMIIIAIANVNVNIIILFYKELQKPSDGSTLPDGLLTKSASLFPSSPN